MQNLVIYIHGKGGSADEGAHYGPLFPGCDVLGFDYRAKTPWEALTEFPAFFRRWSQGYERVVLVASSIGAYFSMMSLGQEKIGKAYFISPIVDMEKLIGDMMLWAGVTEDELREKGEVETAFGETLSWEYLSYVRRHPVRWDIPTEILYGGLDDLTSRDTVAAFALAHGANLTVMESGEHWFHTAEQMAFLDDWIKESEEKGEAW